MPSFVTPARLTALAGVLTGLAAAVTAALGVVPHDGQVYLVGQEVAGLLTTGVSVSKFLEGQAGWEQTQANLAHNANQAALDRQHNARMTVHPALALPRVERELVLTPEPGPEAEQAALPDEVPIESVDDVGSVVYAEADSGEPQRLVDQA